MSGTGESRRASTAGGREPSNQTGRYDYERVARLRPLEAAVKRLGLPPIRSRKLGAILNALEMQIEDGGDSPEVNRRLLEALRAGLRHQADERAIQPALRAIDAFERAEAGRWEQYRAGTLPPVVVPPEDRLGDLMQEGYELLEANQRAAACERWLEAWELVKQLTRPEWRTTTAFDQGLPSGLQSVFNWCQDLEMELGNAGLDDPVYHEHRLRYAREFLERFPDESTDFHLNFARAQGEALWHLGRRAEAEAVYGALVARFPDEAWAYIGWADQYWLGDWAPKEYAQGEAILRRALARPRLRDHPDLLQRLAELYGEWGKPQEQAAVAARLREPARRSRTTSRAPSTPRVPVAAPGGALPPVRKLSRNAPCWCGSGKKYKHCHLPLDEAAKG